MTRQYPRFGPCPYCGERMVLSAHWSSWAVGLLCGLGYLLLSVALVGMELAK